jgi:hypothetical protein
MAPHQVALQRLHLAWLNANIRQLPKAGIDSIRRIPARQQPIHHGPRLANSQRRRRIKRHGTPIQSNLRNFIQGKRLTSE